MSGRSKTNHKKFLKRFLKNWRFACICGSSWREALRIALRRAWRGSAIEDRRVAAYARKTCAPLADVEDHHLIATYAQGGFDPDRYLYPQDDSRLRLDGRHGQEEARLLP
jgi:hypothetical protein